MQQLSLWDAATEEQPTPPGCIAVPDIGGTMEWPTHWADGDTRPEELARLARVVIGKLETFKATNGTKLWFRVTSARVEGDHVVMTLKRIEPLIKGYVTWLREQGQAPDDGRDE